MKRAAGGQAGARQEGGRQGQRRRQKLQDGHGKQKCAKTLKMRTCNCREGAGARGQLAGEGKGRRVGGRSRGRGGSRRRGRTCSNISVLDFSLEDRGQGAGNAGGARRGRGRRRVGGV